MQDNNAKKSFIIKQKTTRIGIFNFIVVLIVLAILVVVNLVIRELPSSVTSIDLTANSMTSISKESLNYARSVGEDVTIYLLCPDGDADKETETFLKRYSDANSHIKLRIIDTAKDPEFVNEYTTTQLSDQSVIIKSDKRFKVIDYMDMYYYYSEGSGAVSADEYQQMYQTFMQYYSYYGMDYFAQNYGFAFTDLMPYFRGETAITQGLEYVVLDSIPHGYLIQGHSSSSPILSGTLTNYLKECNITLDTINLKTDGKIPEDANTLILHAPESDILPEEKALLSEYLKNGGSLLLTTAPGCDEFTNLMALMSEYGLSATPNMLYDPSNANHASTGASWLYPDMNQNNPINTVLTGYGYSMLMPSSHGITVSDELPAGVTVTTIATTSAQAYSIKDNAKDEDSVGKYNVAVSAESTGGAHIAWYASAQAFTDEVAMKVSGGNYYYFQFAMNWMGKQYESAFTELPTVELTTNNLTVTEGEMLIWFVILAIALPLLILAAGFAVWFIRRRR